jgi:hypothetical protein
MTGKDELHAQSEVLQGKKFSVLEEAIDKNRR